MVEWVKVGTNVVVGGGVGAIDQLVQNADDKRIAEKPDLGIMSQYGTYLNYGVPILAIVGTAFGFLTGDWATRLVTAGSQLAGRKATKQVTKKAVPWTAWSRGSQAASRKVAEATHLKEAARQRALAGGARAQVAGEESPISIPIITNETVLV